MESELRSKALSTVYSTFFNSEELKNFHHLQSSLVCNVKHDLIYIRILQLKFEIKLIDNQREHNSYILPWWCKLALNALSRWDGSKYRVKRVIVFGLRVKSMFWVTHFINITYQCKFCMWSTIFWTICQLDGQLFLRCELHLRNDQKATDQWDKLKWYKL